MSKYVTKRGNRFHFVMAIPRDLQPHFRKKRVQMTLRTSSLTEAEALAKLLRDDLLEEFYKIRRQNRYSASERESMVKKLLYGSQKPKEKPKPSTVVEKFIEEHKNNWADKTLLNYRQALRYFVDHVGATALDSISRKQCGEFKDALLRVPKNRSNAEAKLPLQEILKRANNRDTVSRKRVNMLLECVSAFTKWATINGYADTNPMEGIKVIVPKREQKRESRRSWTTAELDLLFSSPLYTGCKHLRRRSVPGDLIIKDYMYWLPIVALYTGARAEELCQLRTEDLKVEDGIYYIDIKETADSKGKLIQVLKNQSSERQVPLHSLILKLGFVEWVKDHNHTMLFAIDEIGADGKWSSAFSRVFGRYKRAIGIDDTGVVFHSFRHCVMNHFKQSGAEQSIVKQLVGHSETTLSLGSYTEKYPLRKVYELVNAISFGIRLEQEISD